MPYFQISFLTYLIDVFTFTLLQEEINQYKKLYQDMLAERNQFKQQCTQGKTTLLTLTRISITHSLVFQPFANGISP